MKKFVRLSLHLLIFAGLFTACKKNVPGQARFIPKNASVVVTLNAKSLQGKLEKSQGDIETMLRNMAADNDTSLTNGKEEWADFKDAGLDLSENFYLWANQKQAGNMAAATTGSAIVGLIGSLKDAGKFEAYLKKKVPASQPQKDKNFSFVTKDGDKMIAWGKDVVMVMYYQQSYSPKMTFDTLTGTYNMQAPAQANRINDLKAEMIASFNQKESESIAALPEYADLAQEKGDVVFWANAGNTIGDMQLPLPKIKDLLANNYTAAILNFEDGKVVIDSRSYTSKPMKDIFEKYAGPEVNLDLVQQYPSNNINGFMVFAFNPQIIDGFVKYMEVGAVVDGYVTQFMGSQFTLQDMLKAFKGDIAVAVSDFNVAPTPGMPQGAPSTGMPTAKMIFTVTVADKALMQKMLDRLVALKIADKTNNRYTPAGMQGAFGLIASMDDKNFTIASDESLLSAYANNKGKNTFKMNEMNDFKGKAGAFYFDIQSLLTVASASPGSMAGADDAMRSAKETFKDVKASMKNFNGKYTEGHMELRLMNEKQNSLTSLIHLTAQASASAKKNSPVIVEEGVDSTAP